MNLIIINGTIEKVVQETKKHLVFKLKVDKSITDESSCYIVFIVRKQETKEKIKKILTEGTEILVEGSIEEYQEIHPGIKIRVKKFYFLQSLQENLEEVFMTFEELNSILDEEIEKYLHEEKENDYE